MTRLAPLLALLLLAAPAAGQSGHPPVIVPSHAIAGTHNCAGYYPPAELGRGTSGRVLVAYDVAADGKIANVRVIKSSGHAALDQAAVACVSQAWRNTPETRDGVPVASTGHKAAIEFRPVFVDVALLPAPPIPVEFYVLGAIIVITSVVAGIVLIRRRRSPVSGPLVCGRCGTVNILPATLWTTPKCKGCGQPFSV